MTRWISLAIAPLALVGTLAGCKSCDGGGETPADAAAPMQTTLTEEQAKQPLAKVGDRVITLGDFAAAIEHMDQFDRLRYQSPERRKELLDEMITVELLAQEATARGWDKDPLAQQELRAILRDAMLSEARKGAPAPQDVPENEVRAYFDAHKAEYNDPERRRVSAIVLKDEAAGREALAAAQKDPTQWGEIVKARSIDPQARAPGIPIDLVGDLGIVAPPGDSRGENPRVPDEVRAAVYTLGTVGDILPKVVAAGGKFYVVKLSQKLPPHERTFQEAERSIRVKLAQDKLRAKENELLAELKKSVKVEIDEAALATVRTDTAVDAGRAPADAGK